MGVVERVKAILLTPKTEWPVIESEAGDVAGIYKSYLVYLAAIPAVASFIGFSLIGAGAFGMSVRMPVGAGLVNGIVGYVVSLALFYVFALIVDALAPTFRGQKSFINAFKLVAYGSTAALAAGIFYLLPTLGLLALLGALYTLYLVYLGLPVLMKCPQEKALVYTVVLVVCGIVLGVIVSALSALFLPQAAMHGMAGGDKISITTPKGEISIDTRKIEEAARRLEQASKQAEASGKSGDMAAAGKAMAEALAAVTGGTAREPIAADALKALLPESLGGMARESFETQSGTAMGIGGSTARAEYRGGDRTLRLEIIDSGGLAGLAALASWMNFVGERETATEREKVYRDGKRTIKERVAKSGGEAEYTVILENGVIVTAEGEGVDLASIKRVVEAMGLERLTAKGGKG